MVLSGIYLAGNIISDDLIVADFSQKGLKPSWKHPFGTDMLGRDMLVRTIKGLSVSITVGDSCVKCQRSDRTDCGRCCCYRSSLDG